LSLDTLYFMFRLSRKPAIAAAIFGAGIVLFAVLLLSGPQQPAVEGRERVWRVETLSVEPAQLAPTLTLYGRVETPELLRAAAPSDGRVATVVAREGQRIEPGQLLLAMDQRDFEPRVRQAQADVDDLEAQLKREQLQHASNRDALAHERALLELAERAVQRARDLRERKLGSDVAEDEARQNLQRQQLAVTTRQLQVDEHGARLRQYEARLERARAALVQAQLDLERSSVSADFAGFVASVEVAAGDQVKRADTLLTLYPSASLEVRAKLPAPYQQELLAALEAGRALRATARIGDRQLVLRLDRVSGKADPGGIDGLFRVERGGDLLRLGSMLTLQLERDAQTAAVAVPYTALYGNDRMYKLVDGRLQGIPVKALGDYAGSGDRAMLLVKSPQLRAGDRLVITHLPNAVDGLRVEDVTGQAAAAGS
jgi:multidrug efflux pump subunit AcrA (membrane-fusion protein)